MIENWFGTPLRAAAMGVLAVALTLLAASLIRGRPRWRGHVLVLVSVALAMVLASNALR